jgi:hypothetical protein
MINTSLRNLLERTLRHHGHTGEGTVMTLGKQQTDGESCESFFSRLGFSSVVSLDISDFEGADIIHDLNEPVPKDLENRYGLVFDGGTLEHCFCTRTAMFNIANMTQLNALAVHCNPVNNCVNHGFYQLSPTFFTSFYNKNGFDILAIHIYGGKKRGPESLIATFEGANLKIAHTSCRMIIQSAPTSDFMCQIMTIAKKTRQVPNEVPTQGFYDADRDDPHPRGIVTL